MVCSTVRGATHSTAVGDEASARRHPGRPARGAGRYPAEGRAVRCWPTSSASARRWRCASTLVVHRVLLVVLTRALSSTVRGGVLVLQKHGRRRNVGVAHGKCPAPSAHPRDFPKPLAGGDDAEEQPPRLPRGLPRTGPPNASSLAARFSRSINLFARLDV